MTGYALALHGGAGVILGRDYTEAEIHLRELAEQGQSELERGDSALDVVERAVAAMDRLWTARPDGRAPLRRSRTS